MSPEDRPQTVPLTTTTSRGGWLLVLGRQANVRTLLVTFLTQAGYAVLGCATLAEAEVILAGQAAPALILVDGEAATEEGLYQSLQQLSTLLPPQTSCPVLLLSLAQPLPRSRFLPGTVRVLAQPFDLTDLLQFITTASDSPPWGNQP
jgi:CheY-like chemotaxis protein